MFHKVISTAKGMHLWLIELLKLKCLNRLQGSLYYWSQSQESRKGKLERNSKYRSLPLTFFQHKQGEIWYYRLHPRHWKAHCQFGIDWQAETTTLVPGIDCFTARCRTVSLLEVSSFADSFVKSCVKISLLPLMAAEWRGIFPSSSFIRARLGRRTSICFTISRCPFAEAKWMGLRPCWLSSSANPR